LVTKLAEESARTSPAEVQIVERALDNLFVLTPVGREIFSSRALVPKPEAAAIISSEAPVNLVGACKALGLGRTYLSAVKQALGIKGRYFFVSQVREFMKRTPGFRVSDVYPRQTGGRGRSGTLAGRPSASAGRSGGASENRLPPGPD
jgi:hypothetical protein